MKAISKAFALFATFAVVPLFAVQYVRSQNPPAIPKIVQVNELTIKELLKPKDKPLLVNFWATWCIPCREEFPDLVEIDKEYKGKIDFNTITLDDLAEINRDVPKFLKEMKATMSTYLLYTNDENGVIGAISKDWTGGLPFTVLYDKNGKIVHTKQGKIKPEVVRSKINKLVAQHEIITVMEFVKILNGKKDEAVYYYENNWKTLRDAALKKAFIHSYELIVADPVEGKDFDIILITRYSGKNAFEKSEENFQEIMKEASGGLKLKNDIKPPEFRKNVSISVGKTIAFPRFIDPQFVQLPKN